MNEPQPNMQNELVQIEAEALQRRNDLAVVKITDQASYNEAVEKRSAAKQWLDGVRAFFKPMKEAAWNSHKKIVEQEKTITGPVETAMTTTQRALVEWDTAQENERRRLEREAREKAAAEAREQQLQDAVHAEEMGAPAEQVEAILEAPPPPAAPVAVAPTYQKSGGIVMRDNWKAEIEDLFAFVKYLAKNKKDIGLVVGIVELPSGTHRSPALDKMAKALKSTLAIPGVRAFNDRGVATGRG